MMISSTHLRRPLRLHCRLQLSRNFAKASSASSKKNASEEVLIYQRENNRATFPRAVLALSTFNSTYWVWYTFDFIPSVNHSPLDQIHVDPTFGYIGIFLGLTIQAASIFYPLRMVSKIEYDRKAQNITTYHHDVPTIFQSAFGHTVPLGKLTLDPASADARKLIEETESFSGALALSVGKERMPLLVDVQQGELKEVDLFVQMLLTPEKLVHVPHKQKRTKKPQQPQQKKKRAFVKRR